MANPLARVVMENVARKTEEKNKPYERTYQNTYEKTYESYDKERNLTSKEEDILVRLINRESKVKEENNSITVLSLDEAADKIRNRK